MKKYFAYDGFWILVIFIFSILMLGTYTFYQINKGYHLEWSSKNLRWIWVDKEGKP